MADHGEIAWGLQHRSGRGLGAREGLAAPARRLSKWKRKALMRQAEEAGDGKGALAQTALSPVPMRGAALRRSILVNQLPRIFMKDPKQLRDRGQAPAASFALPTPCASLAGRAPRRSGEPARGQAAGASAGTLTCAAAVLAAVTRVHLLEIKADAQVQAFAGEPVTLNCWFRSSTPVTEKLTVDWTYRPLAGGSLEPVLHYQSDAYPAKGGSFRDRVSWAGNVAKQDASIMISNPTLEDNGTFTCSVKNPPDVQHNIPQTLLTVTQRGASFQLTSSGLLSILIFLPSAIVVILLLVRMSKKSGLMKARRRPVYKKSSIEVSEEPEQGGCRKQLAGFCLQCLDTDEEEPY
ncbi:myelin protein zero-like protein 3 [Python bivittatus]|uniref:Myelin protein zero-like protein 3 n=1 Tax=Python bivittatus TaxID=176946 RepID=A0A9F5MQK1_PYTBI|nr:myelin protein zero-like protein 3 [Python bivittatus]